MEKKILIFILISIWLTSIYGQNNPLFERLRAINTNGSLVFYNIDGIGITSESMIYSFADFNLKMAYRLYNVTAEKKEKNLTLNYENIYTKTENKINEKITQFNSYYFIKNTNNKVIVFHFSSINKTNEEFEIDFINLVLNDKIPEDCFSNRPAKSLNFASRMIEIEDNCYYANVNSFQCPYNGQINWSLHKDLSDARKQVEYQFEVTKSKKMGKLISEENINLVFEGINTTAKKVIFEVDKNKSNIDLKSIEGKKLIIYYIAEKIRNYNLSCVLSHWEDDKIKSDGLPNLLRKIIQL